MNQEVPPIWVSVLLITLLVESKADLCTQGHPQSEETYAKNA